MNAPAWHRDGGEYRRRAQLHRLTDSAAIAAECRRLHRELRLSRIDLERALRVRPELVADALRGVTGEHEPPPRNRFLR